MNTTTLIESKVLVLDAAKAVSDALYEARNDLPTIIFWTELEAVRTNSGGWSVEIGKVGETSPRLEIWIDKYAGAGGDRFYAGLCAGTATKIQPFIDLGSLRRRWKPIAILTSRDLRPHGRFTRLAKPLTEAAYGHAIVEHLRTREHYFGVYDAIEPSDPLAHTRFCRLAEDFFLGILSKSTTVPDTLDAVTEDDYPAVERRRVRWHMQFERNTRLARQRKQRDQYKCAVCDLFMHNRYGELASKYAEAHHKTPLQKLNDSTVTTLDDLITVCPNCHRMLHRMEGKKDDWVRLRQIVDSRRHI